MARDRIASLIKRRETQSRQQKLKRRENISFGVRLLGDYQISPGNKISRNVSKLLKSPKLPSTCVANLDIPSSSARIANMDIPSSSDFSFEGKY